MRAATALAERTGYLASADRVAIERVIARYGPIPSLEGIQASRLAGRLAADKKTVQGKVHFVLPVRIGDVLVVSSIEDGLVLESIEAVLA
jgi:3-dehydroquinate synthase